MVSLSKLCKITEVVLQGHKLIKGDSGVARKELSSKTHLMVV